MGIIIGIGQTKPQVPYDEFYGIEWDVTVSNPKAKRIGKLELHASLPVQSLMRRCVLRDNGEVAYYLDANDSTKKEGGAPAKLDGTDGQVMVEIPAFYVKFETDGNKRRCLMSRHALPGFTKWDKLYISAYEASIRGVERKLCSVSVDGVIPAESFTLSNARAMARSRGSVSWNCYTYQAHKELFWLFAIEYATFNSQDAFNASLDSQGCRQGGLGAGVSDVTNWDKIRFAPIIKCGVTNQLGDHTGVVKVQVSADVATNATSYRGVENPFGHIFKFIDGIKMVTIGGVTGFYAYSSPRDYGADGISACRFVGNASGNYGYIRSIHFGSSGDITPEYHGGSSSTYFCDMADLAIGGMEGTEMAISVGGLAETGAAAGLTSIYSRVAKEYALRLHGTRICYLP